MEMSGFAGLLISGAEILAVRVLTWSSLDIVLESCGGKVTLWSGYMVARMYTFDMSWLGNSDDCHLTATQHWNTDKSFRHYIYCLPADAFIF